VRVSREETFAIRRVRQAIQRRDKIRDSARDKTAFAHAVYLDRVATALEVLVPRDATEILAIFAAAGVPQPDVRSVAKRIGVVHKTVVLKATGFHYSHWSLERKRGRRECPFA